MPATATGPADAAALEPLVVRDHVGREVALGSLWRQRPVLLVFLRHYGCAFCREQAAGLGAIAPGLERDGIRLVLIGQGTPGNAAAFRRQFDLGCDVLADTDRAAYRAVGAACAGLSQLLGPRVVALGIARSLRSGVHQGRTVGHPAQLGGLLLVKPGGAVAWSHLSTDAADYPRAHEVLAHVRDAL